MRNCIAGPEILNILPPTQSLPKYPYHLSLSPPPFSPHSALSITFLFSFSFGGCVRVCGKGKEGRGRNILAADASFPICALFGRSPPLFSEIRAIPSMWACRKCSLLHSPCPPFYLRRSQLIRERKVLFLFLLLLLGNLGRLFSNLPCTLKMGASRQNFSSKWVQQVPFFYRI